MKWTSFVAASFALAGPVACGGIHLEPSDAGSTAVNGSDAGDGAALPCDVQAVVGASCAACHGASPRFGAPMPLATTADFHAAAITDPSRRVVDLVSERTHDRAHAMPPPPKLPLDPRALSVLDAWIAAGAPPGTAACAPPMSTPRPAVTPLSCTPDQHIRPASRYPIKQGATDEYVCYGFDVPVTAKRHVTALGPRVDNEKLVHHLLLFQSDTAVSSTPTPCEFGGSTAWRMVAEWAPGADNFELPAAAGFAEEGTTHWVMQIHYNNLQGLRGESDESGFDLCTTDKLRPNDADVMAPGSVAFHMAPHSPLDWTCRYPWGSGLGTYDQTYPTVHVFNGLAHMHKLGKALTVTRIRRGGGAAEVVLDAPAFDFQNQHNYPIDIDIAPGDTLETRCRWNNTTDAPVRWGETTEQEMCFGFLAYYPKVTVPSWHWVDPSGAASTTCATTK